MKRIALYLLVGIIFIFLIFGCSHTKDTNTKEIYKSLDYEIVQGRDIPPKMQEKIFEKKSKPFQFAYKDGEIIYLVIGYGEKPTGGYSIQIKDLKQWNEKMIIETQLIPPSPEDVVAMAKSYPYIVIKSNYFTSDIEYEWK